MDGKVELGVDDAMDLRMAFGVIRSITSIDLTLTIPDGIAVDQMTLHNPASFVVS